MKNWKELLLTAAMLVTVSSVQNALGQSTQPQPNSAQSSPRSVIRASEQSEPPAVAGSLTQTRKEAEISGDTLENGALRNISLQPPATAGGSDYVAACMAAVDELKASRVLIEALESENRALNERLETEKQTTAILQELNQTRKNETNALRDALAAKNETILAQDKVIASQDKLVETLKNKKRSPLGRIGDILIGAAIFAVLK